MPAGYYRYPTLHADQILFVTEDDLWSVARSGGPAHRLTSTAGAVLYPALSPDGAQVAFVGNEEGATEVYLMDARGGPLQRKSFLGSDLRVLGWTPDGSEIVFASNYGQPFAREFALFAVAAAASNGEVRQLPFGPARSVAFGPQGQVVLGRFTGEPANWKRYRGGTAGQLWIDATGSGQFERFMRRLGGNITAPMWLAAPHGPGSADRVYFVSDHEGVGNLYSCLPTREDIQRHTDHEEFYVRNPSSDGRHIVYHAGADLYVFDPQTDESRRVEISWRGMRLQRGRRFVDPVRFFDFARLHPTGRAATVTTRGKLFAFYTHDGPVLQLGERTGVRYRLPDWLNDGRRLLVVSDAQGEECLEVHTGEPDVPPRRLEGLEMGRPVSIKVSPAEDKVAIANHRNELLLVDLSEALDGEPASKRLTFVDRSLYGPIAGMDWSSDGQWLAYSSSLTPKTAGIRLYCLAAPLAPEAPLAPDAASNGADAASPGPEVAGSAPAGPRPNPITITRPVLRDVAPTFDPDGNYLYFLSFREFNPVYDALHLDLGFPWGMRPYLLTLREELPNPFIPRPDLDEEEEKRERDASAASGEKGGAQGKEEPAPRPEPAPPAPAEPEPVEPEPGEPEPEPDLDAADAAAPPAAPVEDVPAPDGGEQSDGEPSDEEPSGPDGDAPAQALLRPVYGAPQLYALFTSAPAAPAADTAAGAAPAAPAELGAPAASAAAASAKPRRPMQIDLDGISRRILPFPVPDARYGQIHAVSGKALFTAFDLVGTLDNKDWDDDDSQAGTLRAWNFKDYRSELLVERVSWFDLSRNRKKMVYSSGRRLRVLNAGEKPGSESGPSRRTGWLDLSRIKVTVEPLAEWQQMFREAWRLQRDHFWSEDMASVDWHAVFARYYPLIARVSTRLEFSDLIREMQGELGTSHTYEVGGDFRLPPNYGVGMLGARFRWDAEGKGYRVEELVAGDPWIKDGHSPLVGPGVEVKAGDLLVAVNGQRLDGSCSPAQLLVHQAGHEVLLTFAEPPAPAAAPAAAPAPPGNGEQVEASPANPPAAQPPALRSLVVRTLRSETLARYRSWIENNRRLVHAQSKGRVGYVHIPDMGPAGYAEFHRGYLAETDRDAMVIDVRYNGGGHVSQLILEKLARRRIGYETSRWGGVSPYPADSVAGPQVALTNEYAGSDGDIFCHSFKILKLGPLVGKRTWGGVVGISPRHPLVDGTQTTQPEFGFWFQDVGWNVENYGTDPDIEVDYAPQDYAAGRDPQLARAVDEALRLLAMHPVLRPDFAARPSLAQPRLPPRSAAPPDAG